MPVAYGFGVGDDIEIRPLRASEYAAAGKATVSAFREYLTPDAPGWEAYLARIADIESRADRAVVLIATERGAIAGSVTLELESRISPGPSEPRAPDEAHVRMLGVSPEHRGRGIARRLMLACIEMARDQGKRAITLDTDPMMTAAQQLYDTLGFKSAGLQARPDGLELLSYRLDLDSEARTTR